MTSDALKKAVRRWADKIGSGEAMNRLIKDADISVAVSQKLVLGNYESELGFDKAQKILKLMVEEGVLPDKAS